jgi:peptide/nickel transport system substrate-binding protein
MLPDTQRFEPAVHKMTSLRFSSFSLGLSTLALVALLAACGGGSKDDAGPGPAAQGGPTESRGAGKEPLVSELGGPRDTMVVAYQSDVGTLLSIVNQSAADGMIVSNINFNSTNADFDCELTYVPELYESWQFNEDQTEMTVKIKEGIRWYDGQPITARDVKFTYDLVADPAVASPRLAYIENMDMEKGAPELVDDMTLRFHFKHAYDRITMEAHTSLTPVPEHALKDADRATLRGHELARAPLVSGPWKIETWDKNERIVLVPNEKFSGPERYKPRIKRVVFKILPEYATRLVELENGSADMMEGVLVSDAERLAKEHPEIKLYRRGWRFMDYVAWNTLDAADYKAKRAQLGDGEEVDWSTVKPNRLFADKAVRRALTKAIDIDKLIQDLLTTDAGESYGRPAVSTITPELCKIHNNDIQRIPLAPSEARAELEAAGWKDSDSDGILDKGGEPFRFTLLTNSGNARRAKAAIIIQANLKSIGVDMQIEKTESNTFFERLRKKDYEATLSGWSAGLFVDMTDMWHSGDRYEFNFTSYANPEVDRIIKEAIREPDPEKNAALWKQAQAMIYEDQPYTFLYWQDSITGLHERFKDAKVDILSAIHNMNTWWVPAAEVKYAR